MFLNNSPFHHSTEPAGGTSLSPRRACLLDASPPLTRRDFLWRSGGGLGGIALAALLDQERLLAAPESDAPLAPAPHHRPAEVDDRPLDSCQMRH